MRNNNGAAAQNSNDTTDEHASATNDAPNSPNETTMAHPDTVAELEAKVAECDGIEEAAADAEWRHRKFKLAHADRKNAPTWYPSRVPYTWETLKERHRKLGAYPVSAKKDRSGTTTGTFYDPKGEGVARKAGNVESVPLLVFDVENGFSIQRAEEVLTCAGLEFMIEPSINHKTTKSPVTEKKILEFAEQNFGSAPEDFAAVSDEKKLEVLRAYFGKTKSYEARLLDSFHTVSVDFTDGKNYVAHHHPMHRFHIVLPLSEEFVFMTADAIQSARQEEYTERYFGFAAKHGLPVDPACGDCCRMMYNPGRWPDSDETEFYTRISEAGRPVFFDDRDAPRLKSEKKARAAKKSKTASEEIPPHLKHWMNCGGSTMEYAVFRERELGVETIRGGVGGKYIQACPNEGEHTPTEGPDTGFMSMNASESERGRPIAFCNHTCKEKSGGDFLWYLKKDFEALGILDDKEELARIGREYCNDFDEEKWMSSRAGGADSHLDEDEREARAAAQAAFDKLRAQLLKKEEEHATEARKKIESLIAAAKVPSDLDGIVTALACLTEDEVSFHLNTLTQPRASNPFRGQKKIITKRVDAKRDERQRSTRATLNDERKRLAPTSKHFNSAGRIIYGDERDEHGRLQLSAADKGENFTNEIVGAFSSANKQRGEPMVYTSLDTLAMVSPRGKVMTLDTAGLQGAADKLVTFTDKGGYVIHAPSDTMGIIVKDVHRDRDAFPELLHVVNGPRYGADFELINKPGFYPNSKTLYWGPALEMPPIEVTDKNVARARETLEDVIVDIPIRDLCDAEDQSLAGLAGLDLRRAQGKSSKAAVHSLMLTALVKPALGDAGVPAFLGLKAQERVGASLLMTAVMYAVSGEKISATAMPVSEEEWPKALLTAAREKKNVLFFDNTKKKIDNGIFAASLTQGRVSGRQLGVNADIVSDVTWVTLITGINPEMSGELAKRTVYIRLEAETADPEKRTGFIHADLLAWVLEHRAEIVWALCILVENWKARGRPLSKTPFGGFEKWVGVVGGILECAGIEGLLDNRDVQLEGVNAESDEDIPVYEAWAVYYGEAWVGAGDALCSGPLGLTPERSGVLGLVATERLSLTHDGQELDTDTWKERTQESFVGKWLGPRCGAKRSIVVKGKVMQAEISERKHSTTRRKEWRLILKEREA